jgi:hypothetical protein
MNTETLKNRKTKRTTITLEADVADFIQETVSKNKGIKEKQIINKLLRLGIKSERNQPNVSFKIDSFKTKLVSNVSPEDIEKLLDEI